MASVRIIKRVNPACSICGRRMHVVVYSNRSRNGGYRGGHYFGNVPIYKKGDWEKFRRRFGTRTVKIGALAATMLKKEPKPQGHFEYWECPKCYWKK